MIKFSFIAVTTGTLLASTVVAGQTLSERVAASKRGSGTPVVITIVGDLLPLSIDELAARSDLVVEARLTRLKTYINAADTAVITDYAILPNHVLRGVVPSSTRTPGASTQLVLSDLGGELVQDGVTVRTENHNREPMKDGGRYLLFLKRFGNQPGVYHTYNGGAFELTGDRMRALAIKPSEAYKRFSAAPFSEASRKIAPQAPPKP